MIPGSPVASPSQPPIEIDNSEGMQSRRNRRHRRRRRRLEIKLRTVLISETEITMEQFMPYGTALLSKQKENGQINSVKPLEFGPGDGVNRAQRSLRPDIHFQFAMWHRRGAARVHPVHKRDSTRKWLSLANETRYRLPMRSQWQHACRAEGQQETRQRKKPATESPTTNLQENDLGHRPRRRLGNARPT